MSLWSYKVKTLIKSNQLNYPLPPLPVRNIGQKKLQQPVVDPSFLLFLALIPNDLHERIPQTSPALLALTFGQIHRHGHLGPSLMSGAELLVVLQVRVVQNRALLDFVDKHFLVDLNELALSPGAHLRVSRGTQHQRGRRWTVLARKVHIVKLRLLWVRFRLTRFDYLEHGLTEARDGSGSRESPIPAPIQKSKDPDQNKRYIKNTEKRWNLDKLLKQTRNAQENRKFCSLFTNLCDSSRCVSQAARSSNWRIVKNWTNVSVMLLVLKTLLSLLIKMPMIRHWKKISWEISSSVKNDKG